MTDVTTDNNAVVINAGSEEQEPESVPVTNTNHFDDSDDVDLNTDDVQQIQQNTVDPVGDDSETAVSPFQIPTKEDAEPVASDDNLITPTVDAVSDDAVDNSDQVLDMQAAREGRKPEELKHRLFKDAEALVEYGGKIIASSVEFQETLTPAQEVFKIIHDVTVKENSLLNLSVHQAQGKKYELVLDYLLGYPAIGIKVTSGNGMQMQTWIASPLASDTKFNLYERQESSTNTDDGFDTVTTIKKRVIKPEDVDALNTAAEAVLGVA